ncbi:hypothetical protein ERJ75_000105300 [Trypanosoma vivax]|nr:hypothetical protein ERJ75_000105300 [Trypanosoma vivax]
MVELERDAGAARLAMDALRVKGEEARSSCSMPRRQPMQRSLLSTRRSRQRPRAVAPTRRLAVTAPTARTAVALAGRCRLLLPALTHVAPP